MSIHNDKRKALFKQKDKVKIYETPKWFFQRYNKKYNFQWDMAASKKNTLCKNYVTEKQDALSIEWPHNTTIWCNPPYESREFVKWMKKAWDVAHKGTTTVFLVHARTDTKWYHEYAQKAEELHFVRGRIKFYIKGIQEKCGAPFPSLVVIFTPKCTYFSGIATPMISFVDGRIIRRKRPIKRFPRK